jgi:penicillin-binding protein 1A
MNFILNLFKKLLILGVFLAFMSFSMLIYFLWKFSPELPSYNELKSYNPSLTSRVFTSDGLLLDKYFIQERIFVPINRIPVNLIHAFISAEDKKFFDHIGVDPVAIIRAVFSNIVNKFSNKKMIGASTITQQVVKNLLLTDEVSLERKFKEMILAVRIENILNKEQILELYLNDIYLGYGSYGIAAASLNYFNKSINELTIEEDAFLAALPKAPNNYNPQTKYSNAIERRNWVLQKMYENGYISKAYLQYKNKPLIVQDRYEEQFKEANYFKEEVRKELYGLFGKQALYEQGLIVKTSINTKLQKIADHVLISGLINQDKKNGWKGVLANTEKRIIEDDLLKNIKNPFPNKWDVYQVTNISESILEVTSSKGDYKIVDLSYEDNKWLVKEKFKIGDVFFTELIADQLIIRQTPKINGAIVVIDPHTGKVLALSGGFSFALSEFNRATQAKRQPGSAFKPFVYIAAMKEGYTPATLILDAPYVVDQGPGLPKWKPSNYTDKFYGLSPMRTGIEKSRNLMTIRLSDKIGMEKILNTARDFKIEKYMDNNLSMSLGSGLVTLLDLTNAYAMIVNGGKEIKPSLITSVYDKAGKQILINEINRCDSCNQINSEIDYSIPAIINDQQSVLDPRIAYQITSMLEGVILRGTGRRIKELDIPLGGKTGTTNDNKDAWFVGFSPDLAVGVYVGFDQPKSLGYKQTGSAVAVPIFKEFMKEAQVNPSKIPFRVPSGISFVKIDPKTGLVSKISEGMFEPFIIGTEPYNKSGLKKLDNLGTINNNSISGTGSLLSN